MEKPTIDQIMYLQGFMATVFSGFDCVTLSRKGGVVTIEIEGIRLDESVEVIKQHAIESLQAL